MEMCPPKTFFNYEPLVSQLLLDNTACYILADSCSHSELQYVLAIIRNRNSFQTCFACFSEEDGYNRGVKRYKETVLLLRWGMCVKYTNKRPRWHAHGMFAIIVFINGPWIEIESKISKGQFNSISLLNRRNKC